VAKDPYRYFRIEVREILDGLAKGALELEKGGAQKEVVGRLFRYAHTLKGAARVVKQVELADAAHALEDVLSPHRDGALPVPRETIDKLLRFVDETNSALASLVAETPPLAPAPEPSPAPEVKTEQLETVRIEIQEMDALLDQVLQASAQVNGLASGEAALAEAQQVAFALLEEVSGRRANRSLASSLERARAIAEELREKLDRAGRRLAQGRDQAESAMKVVRERAHRLRLLPASTIFDALERATRDAALAQGVRVELVSSGGDSRLDGHVLFAVRDALLHVVRNAVAHGIEAPADRARLAKPATGRIHLHVEQRGQQVIFACRDDGRGIDVKAVRRAAVDRGLMNAAEAAALPDHAAMQLVFLPGFSTTKEVTGLSGRGVGLDVVRETAHRFKGGSEVRSELGRMTLIQLRVLVSLSSLVALLVEIGGAVFALPLDSASGALRVGNKDIIRAGGRESVLYRDTAIPFAPMARLLGHEDASEARRGACSAVVLHAGGRMAAIGIDRLLGTSELVIKPLPELAGPVPLVMGASLDADGNAQLMLDPAALIDATNTARGSVIAAEMRRSRPAILVIDDSLTTRMLEQSILESAGYEVDLATSAEEGLEKARQRTYGLFVCDVEMPGMDGYGFVKTTRADPTLREVPVIMVTSLGSTEHRQRGLDAGASEYIVKGEFDQGRLLHHIRALIG